MPATLDGALFNYHIMRLRLSEQLMLPELFLAYVRGAPAVAKYLEDVNHGATRDGINTDQLVGMPVVLPPLNEQRRIVAKLEALQTRSRRAREALNAVPPLLEKLRQSILAAAFRGDLTKDWRAKQKSIEPATELLKRIRTERRQKWEAAEVVKLKSKGRAPSEDSWKRRYAEPQSIDSSNLPELPENWCWASLDEIADLVTGGTPPGKQEGCYGGSVPFFKPTDLDAGREVVAARQYLTEAGAAHLELLPAGSVLITCIGATIGKTGLARVACATNQQINAAVPCVLESECLYWWIVGPVAQSWIIANASATTLPIINKGRLGGMPVALAPVAEQVELCSRLASAAASWGDTSAIVDRVGTALSDLERSVLAKAFRGELVPQDPNDEPAEAMLARARATNGAAATNGAPPKRGRPRAAQRAESSND